MGGFCRFFESKWHLKGCVAVAGGGMVDRKKGGVAVGILCAGGGWRVPFAGWRSGL